MPPRTTSGRTARRLMRDALIRELQKEHAETDSNGVQKLELIARKLVDRAIASELSAIKEIFDRVDGRPAQPEDIATTDGRDLRELSMAELIDRIDDAIERVEGAFAATVEATEERVPAPRAGGNGSAHLCQHD